MWVTHGSLKKEKHLPVVCRILAAAPLIREENSSLEKLGTGIRTSVSRHLWLHYDTWHSNTTCLFTQKLVPPDTQLWLSACHTTALDWDLLYKDAILLPCFVDREYGFPCRHASVLQFSVTTLCTDYTSAESQFQINVTYRNPRWICLCVLFLPRYLNIPASLRSLNSNTFRISNDECTDWKTELIFSRHLTG